MEKDIDDIISEKENTTIATLQSFIENTQNSVCFNDLDKNDRRIKLWQALHDLAKTTADHGILSRCFTAFKILSRDKTYLNELATEELLKFIENHAGISEKTVEDNEESTIEALKCLCNMVFNSPVVLTMCCNHGIVEGIMRRVKSFKDPKMSENVRFFDMKLLFLITSLYPEVHGKLNDELRGVARLTDTLNLILSEAAGESGHNRENEHGVLTDIQVDTLCEILKSLFNLTSQSEGTETADEEKEFQFMNIAPITRRLLVFPKKNAAKQSELTNHVVNLLYNVPEKFYPHLVIPVGADIPKEAHYRGKDMSAVQKILDFLESKFAEGIATPKQQVPLSPSLCVLLKCANSSREMRKYLRHKILPPLRDVHTRPEQGNKLRNCLCSLMTTPMTQVSELSAELLFVLCKQNVARMIKYTGYGNAAGLFANRGLLGGRKSEEQSSYSSESEDSDTEEYKIHKHGINPVTGVYEPPRSDPTVNMTEEQKEYEAMQLVKLMDDLLKTGVVKPCRVGEDGKPEPIESVLQLQEGLRGQQVNADSDDE